DSGGTFKSTGSLSVTTPEPIVHDDFPPNVSARSEAATITESLPCKAIRAAPMGTGGLPKAFERRTRTLVPPTLARTIMRTVWLFRFETAGGIARFFGAAD